MNLKDIELRPPAPDAMNSAGNGTFFDREWTEAGPFIPKHVSLRAYQNQAVKSWAANGYRGIFDMATGTGKTYTALAAAVDLYESLNKRLAVIIVCPYQHLVEQWKTDIQTFGMKPIICYSTSPQKNWKDRLKTAVASFSIGVQEHFCMVSTNAMFATEFVQTQIDKLSGNVVLIVDEAHNFGAENLSTTLKLHIKYRLALSATLDRHGDPEGTSKLYEYFGKKCFEYSLKDAIDNHMLTPYFYYPVVVSLNEDELGKYLELTRRISKLRHTSKKKGKISEHAKMLLIKRARIVAGASEKIVKLKDIIADYQNKRHILVYCGATTMRDIDYREDKPPIDEMRQVDVVTDLLGNELGMRISKFTAEEDTEERKRIISNFDEGLHLQALVAIRCLDEGVNIPSIRTAFILASSTNPKEYIQRRGRVLRTFPGKPSATIFDFITIPVPFDAVDHVDSTDVEGIKSLAIREIKRMKDFASIAENPYESDSLISRIMKAFDISNIEEEGEDMFA